jgi:hypothetical protein
MFRGFIRVGADGATGVGIWGDLGPLMACIPPAMHHFAVFMLKWF